MTSTVQKQKRVTTRLTEVRHVSGAAAAIQRAVSGVVGTRAAPPPAKYSRSPTRGRAVGFLRPVSSPQALDPSIFQAVGDVGGSGETTLAETAAGVASPGAMRSVGPLDRIRADPAVDTSQGEFIGGTHTHGSQTRDYKLFVPPDQLHRQLPLVVMLHGCSQDPDDFAAGTGMNEEAREQGFFVLYPAQSRGANALGCWNWFQQNDQHRDSGEPAVLADMTLSMMERHRIDPRRVYIAGLSAGGAMAAIVADAYPEIFAAVGVHSGVPCGAASNVLQALSVMKSGDTSREAPATVTRLQKRVSTIVFHGDKDQTVHPRNGEQVIAAVLGSRGTVAADVHALTARSARVEEGVSAQGQRYTRSTHHDDSGNAVAEHWLVHGAGHAWSGGNAVGSYTDAKGPDATRAMLRFFFEQPVALTH